MDPPVKKKRDRQRQSRARKNAAVDSIEEVRARDRQRYYKRIARLKAAGEYEAFKQRKWKGDCGATTPCQQSNGRKSNART